MPANISGLGERIRSIVRVGVNCNALCKREDVKNSTSAAHMGIVIRQPRCFASPQYSRSPFCFASAGFDMLFMSIEMRFLYNFVAIGMRLWLSKPTRTRSMLPSCIARTTVGTLDDDETRQYTERDSVPKRGHACGFN
jgi:hypothetical protein